MNYKANDTTTIDASVPDIIRHTSYFDEHLGVWIETEPLNFLEVLRNTPFTA